MSQLCHLRLNKRYAIETCVSRLAHVKASSCHTFDMDSEVTWDESLPRIEIVDGFAVTPRLTIESKIYPGVAVRVEVVFDPILERLTVESIRAEAMPGEEVTGKVLRAIRVQDFVREAVDHMLYRRLPNGAWESLVGLDSYFVDDDLPVQDRELVAAKAYAMAKLLNIPPLKSVGELLGVSQSTATRLVAKARANGKLV